MAIEVLVENSAGQSTVTRMQLLWDGSVIDDQSFSPAVQDVGLAGTTTAGAGNHTVGVKVISQVGSSVVYAISPYVQARNAADNVDQEADPASATRSLSTGSTTSFSLTLH
ncbi:MAG TPA: hypothetical protein VHW65_02060 [Gemmatimonadales bacterium]|nr:hypothetical protein [Gemmatimonadales bacterium]